MELSILKWGNSAAMRIPKELLELLRVSLGDKVAVEVLAEGVMLKSVRPKYTLDALLAQCDPSAPAPADLAAWDKVKPVGNEVW